MGQTAVALPDTSDKPSATNVSADDLLAQLAGDEIDRMLAETDKPSEAPATPVVATPAPPPAAETPVVTKPAPVEPAAADQNTAMQAELDALLKEVSAESPQQTEPQQTEPQQTESGQTKPPETQADGLIAAVAAASSAPPELDPVDALADSAAFESPSAVGGEAGMADAAASAAALDAQLVTMLNEPAPEPAPVAKPATERAATAVPKPAPIPEADDEPHADAWYLKPLQLLSAPLANATVETRELIGKVAIVTAFNAVVVFVYVLFFRA